MAAQVRASTPPPRRTRPVRQLLRPHPHDREILRLAVPALGALVAEPLFLLADSAIVGHLGTAELAGLAVAGAALAFLVSVCVFLAYGTTAAVARRLGADDLRRGLQLGIDGIWLAAGLGVLLAVVALVAAPQVVALLGASAEAATHGSTFLRISAAGIPAMLVVFAATGVLRGLQDTTTPLLVAAAGATANVVLNVILVYGVGLGIAGSALGTVLVQTASAGAYGVIVVRGARRYGASLRPDLPGIRAAGAAGVPLVVRTITLRLALLLATYVAGRHGDVALAAHQVTFAVWNLLLMVLDALAIAGQAIVGRYLGAGDVDGTRRATRRMVELSVLGGVALGVAVIGLRPVYIPWFTSDADVRALLAVVLVVAAALQPLAGAVYALDGVLIGAGDGRYLAWAGVWTLVAFAPLAGVVGVLSAGLPALWVAIGGFLLVRLVTLLLRARGEAWLVTGASVPSASMRRPGRRHPSRR